MGEEVNESAGGVFSSSSSNHASSSSSSCRGSRRYLLFSRAPPELVGMERMSVVGGGESKESKGHINYFVL